MKFWLFRSGAEKVIGKPFPDADKEERWKAISQTKGFWANLDWMPGAKRLWNFISKYDTEILSAYSRRDGTTRTGKLKWLSKNTKIKRGKINLVMRSDKQKYALTNEIKRVIDDYIKNIKEWERRVELAYTTPVWKISQIEKSGF